jgi:tRNA threonylcarbamoyladenosine biosynthesis protein TsaE
LGRRLEGGEVICLTGPLGAGKTCLTQGIAAGLGIEEVGSPSYVLIAQFHGRLTLFHVDAYRLTPDDPSLSDTGIDECLTDAGVCVIEWADRIVSWLPPAFLEIRLDHLPQGRLVQIRPEGTRYHTLAKDLRSRVCAWH